MAETLRYRVVELLIHADRGMYGCEISFALLHRPDRGVMEACRILSKLGYLIRSGSQRNPFYDAVGHMPPKDGRAVNGNNFKQRQHTPGSSESERVKRAKEFARNQRQQVHPSPLAQALEWTPNA